MDMHIKTYTRVIAMMLALLLIATVVPLQTAKADVVGSGGGGGGTGYSNSFLAWGNIANSHSGIRVSVVDSEGKNQLRSPSLELETGNNRIRVSVDILADNLYNNIRNGIKKPARYTENKFGYGDKKGLTYVNMATVTDKMYNAIEDHPKDYGKTAEELKDFKKKLIEDGKEFPNSVKTVNGIFQGNGKDVRSFFVLGQLGAYDQATQVKLDVDTKLEGLGNLDVGEFDRQLKELVAQK